MQLELGVGPEEEARRWEPAPAPRVLALCLPDLPLQRVWRAREAVPPGSRARRSPLAVERGGRVVACDAEARARGVKVGSLIAQARAACGELEVVPASEAEERAALEGLAEVLLALAPAVEIAWPDTLLLDASGARLVAAEQARERTGGNTSPQDLTPEGAGALSAPSAGALARCEALLVGRALAVARERGWRGRAALASGRGPARALARHGPPAAPVPAGATGGALARLPLEALELSPETSVRLAALGLREVGELALLAPETLAHRFGPQGLLAWRFARGEIPRPSRPSFRGRSPPRGSSWRHRWRAPSRSSSACGACATTWRRGWRAAGWGPPAWNSSSPSIRGVRSGWS